MKNEKNQKTAGPFTFVFGKLFTKLTQSPEVYPIKYYIRKKRSRREGYIYSLK